MLNLYIFYILDKILFLNEFNFLSELRLGLFIYFALLIVFLIVQEKLKFLDELNDYVMSIQKKYENV